ncbi:MAG: histidine kinase dimerization/phospho-acceptor domain-containing protein [Anaerolineae bacterium]
MLKQRLFARLQLLWDNIVRPHHTVIDPYDRTGARLLALLSFATMWGAIAGCVLAIIVPNKTNGTLIMVVGIPISAIIYILSRSRYYRLGLILSTVINFVAMYFAIRLSLYPPMYAIGMVIPLLVASLFWSVKTMVAALIAASIAVTSIIGFEPRLNIHLFSTLLMLAVPTICTVYITHLRHRNTQRLVERSMALIEKEAHYRSLFELSPISLWEEDFSEVRRYLDHLRPVAVPDLETYLVQHPEAVTASLARIKVTHVNQATIKLYGADSQTHLLANLSTIIHNDNHIIFVKELLAIAEGKHEYELLEHEFNRTLHGKRLDLSLRWVVVPGYEDDFSRVIVAVEDITERKRLENQRLELTLERERMNLLRQFIGDVSHDLNTSLTVLRTSLYLLQKQTNEACYPRLQTMEAQVTRLEKMIQDMVFTSKLDFPQYDDFRFQPTEIGSWLQYVTDNYQALALARQQIMKVEYSDVW